MHGPTINDKYEMVMGQLFICPTCYPDAPRFAWYTMNGDEPRLVRREDDGHYIDIGGIDLSDWDDIPKLIEQMNNGDTHADTNV